jgi:hypothetical protein
LDEVKKGSGKNTLDAKAYANDFYQEKILKSTDKAIEIGPYRFSQIKEKI